MGISIIIDKIVMWLSYLYDRNHYYGKTASVYKEIAPSMLKISSGTANSVITLYLMYFLDEW